MKAFSTICLLILLAVVSFTTADADSVPQSVETALQERAQKLSHCLCNWQVDYNEVDAGETPQQVAAKQRAVAEQLPVELKKQGITDDSIIKQEVASLVQHYSELGESTSYSSSTQWQVERDGTETLVNGIRKLVAGPENGSSQYYRQYYKDNQTLVINDKTEIDGASAKPEALYAWTSFGNSLCYRPLCQGGLGLLPEHFVLTTGLNPLMIYGAHWHLVSASADAWQLATDVTQRGWAPFRIRMTLSRSHGDAPAQIYVNSGRETINFDTQSFRPIQGTWIPDKIKFTDDMSGTTMTQVWSLLNVGDAKPINLTYTGTSAVVDYRLLGPDLDVHVQPVLHTNQKNQLVIYPWPGHFPGLEELKGIHDSQHPGEGVPDPGKSASLPFVGGVMALTGAVWMFKRRGGSA